MVEVVQGDLFTSGAQTLVNTVNTVGVMGKGVALEFRKRFPEMHDDYVERCRRGLVRLGQPYLYRPSTGPWIVNFPTKEHWRSVSRLNDIVAGLDHLERHYREWGVTSLAVPPLGCGNGQLEWRVVGPVLFEHLRHLDIPVKLYAPLDAPVDQLTLPLLDGQKVASRVEPGWVGVATIVNRVHAQRYRAPIGRVILQKIAYFATVAGLPTGLIFGRGSFGPFSAELKSVLTKLVNNGILEERYEGHSFSVEPGPAYRVAAEEWATELIAWEGAIERVTDLFMRIRGTRQAEVTATIDFAARQLQDELDRPPSEREVFDAVAEWKRRSKQPPSDREIAETIRELNILGWLRVPVSGDLPLADEDALLYA